MRQFADRRRAPSIYATDKCGMMWGGWEKLFEFTDCIDLDL